MIDFNSLSPILASDPDMVVAPPTPDASRLPPDPGAYNAGRQALIQQEIDLSFLRQGTATKANRVLSDAEARQYFYRWQYAASSAIAERVMISEYSIQKKVNDGWEDLPKHPLTDLLANPNDFMTGLELLYWAVADCMMIGKSFWHIIFNSMNEPGRIYPLIGTVKPVRAANGDLIGWKQEFTGPKGDPQTITYEPEEIVYLRLPKPGDIFGGLGPGVAAGSAIRLDNQIVESHWTNFKQGVFPPAILFLTEKDPNRRRMLVEQFNERYAAARESGEVIGVTKDKMDVQWPQRQGESAYVQSEKSIRETVLGIFRISPAILGITENVNRATAEAMGYLFSLRILPIVKLLEARLNQDLVRRYYGAELRIQFKDVVPANQEFELKQQQADVQGGVLSINEVRASRGLEPSTWGEVPIMPVGVAPIEGGGEIEGEEDE